MTEGAGVLRSESSLKETQAQLKQLSTRTSIKPDIDSWESTNLYLLATAIIQGALARQESRGSHWRSDYPLTSEAYRKRITQSFDREGNWHLNEIAVNQ